MTTTDWKARATKAEAALAVMTTERDDAKIIIATYEVLIANQSEELQEAKEEWDNNARALVKEVGRTNKAEAELDRLAANQRTPGTVPVCEICHSLLSSVQKRGCKWTAIMRGDKDCPIICSVSEEGEDGR